MKKSLISVIIDTYNYGIYIEQAIESVLAQQCFPDELEIVIVDDGSSDDTRERVRKYGDRVNYVSQDNQGQAGAFNTGFARTSGEFVFLLDADDIWYPEKVKKVIERFRTNPRLGIVRHYLRDIDHEGKPIGKTDRPPDIPKDTAGLETFLERRIFMIGSSGIAFRREFLNRILPVPVALTICPDEYLSSHILLYADMATIPECLGARRLHTRNSGLYVSNILNVENLRNYIRIRRELDAHLRRRIRDEGVMLKRDIFLLSDVGILKAEVLLASMTGKKMTGFRQLAHFCFSSSPTPRLLFNYVTLLVGILSPAIYRRLYSFYAGLSLVPAPALAPVRLSHKIISNTTFNILGRLWSILVTLLLTPYIIRTIGIEAYGIWSIVFVLTGYAALLDFGIGSSFVKYIAEFHIRKQTHKINQLLSTGILFYLALALVTTAIGFALREKLVGLFNVPPELRSEAALTFVFAIILYGLTSIMGIFSAVPVGLQRMDVGNKLAVVLSFPMIAGTIYFLGHGYGLTGLIINAALNLVLALIASVIVAFRFLPELQIKPSYFSRSIFKLSFLYGYKLQVSRIAEVVHYHTDKLLLAHFLNVASVTYYSVASGIATRARELPLMLVSALIPAAAELDAQGNKGYIDKLYYHSLKYLFIIAVPVTVLTIMLAKPFIQLWLGNGYGLSVITLQLLIGGYFFNMLTGPGFTILNGIGKPEYGMRSSIVATVLNLTLSVFLVIKLGYLGVVLGTGISMILAALYFIRIFHRVSGISFITTARTIFVKPLLAVAISAALATQAIRSLATPGWFGLCLVASLFFILYWFLITRMNYFDAFEKDILSRYRLLRFFMTRSTNS